MRATYPHNIHPHTAHGDLYSYIHAYGLLRGSHTPQRGLSALKSLGQTEAGKTSQPIQKVVHNIQGARQKIKYCAYGGRTVIV